MRNTLERELLLLSRSLKKSIHHRNCLRIEITRRLILLDRSQLIEIAGLTIEIQNEINNNNNFGNNWATMKDWKSESRYKIYSQQEATDMYNALVGRYDGVYRWVIKYW